MLLTTYPTHKSLKAAQNFFFEEEFQPSEGITISDVSNLIAIVTKLIV